MKNTDKIANKTEIQNLIDQGALFIVNHSGGKDSQAMFAMISRMVPRSQIVVVHADLGRVEWTGVKEHIMNNIDGHELQIALPLDKDGNTKDLLSTVERRHEKLQEKREATGRRISPWPSPAQRWCTSDFKAGPIEREIRRIMKELGATLAVNCLGLRADESDRRECGLDKKAFEQTGEAVTLALDAELSKAGRTVYKWLPIHKFSTPDVFSTIAEAGQRPHPMYQAGMSRLSCCFCIMASKADLKIAAQANPELYSKYVELEKKTGYTMQNKSLVEITGISA